MMVCPGRLLVVSVLLLMVPVNSFGGAASRGAVDTITATSAFMESSPGPPTASVAAIDHPAGDARSTERTVPTVKGLLPCPRSLPCLVYPVGRSERVSEDEREWSSGAPTTGILPCPRSIPCIAGVGGAPNPRLHKRMKTGSANTTVKGALTARRRPALPSESTLQRRKRNRIKSPKAEATEADLHDFVLRFPEDSETADLANTGVTTFGHDADKPDAKKVLAEATLDLGRINPVTLSPPKVLIFQGASDLVIESRKALQAGDNIRAVALAEKAKELAAHVDSASLDPFLSRLMESFAKQR